MGELRPWHIAVLVVVLVLLFGSRRLPDAARALGRSMRILKAETKGLADDNAADDNAASGNAPDGNARDGNASGGERPATGQTARTGSPAPAALDGQPTRPPAESPARSVTEPVERTRDS